jgi:hypothetical protein
LVSSIAASASFRGLGQLEAIHCGNPGLSLPTPSTFWEKFGDSDANHFVWGRELGGVVLVGKSKSLTF